mgnify:CR=1 FL=1
MQRPKVGQKQGHRKNWLLLVISYPTLYCAHMTAMESGVSSTSGADTACSAVAFAIAYGIKTLEEFLVGLVFALVFKNYQV